MNPLIIIPSRLASTRLPGKPLADLMGKPMILHVVERAKQANLGPVVVAAGDVEIAEIVNKSGNQAILTDPQLPSGSDRIYAALCQMESPDQYDVIINLQGDLPIIEPEDIKRILIPLKDRTVDIATLIAPIYSEFEKKASSVVKVACSFSKVSETGNALYFSRATIPYGDGPLWHHVGIYAYRSQSLKQFVSLPPSSLEKQEKLEQLRALENKMIIGCAKIEQAPFGVDTPGDLDRVRELLRNKE